MSGCLVCDLTAVGFALGMAATFVFGVLIATLVLCLMVRGPNRRVRADRDAWRTLAHEFRDQIAVMAGRAL